MKNKSIMNSILCAIGWNTPEKSEHNQIPFDVKYNNTSNISQNDNLDNDINHISNSKNYDAKYFLDKEIQNVKNQNKIFKNLAILSITCSIILTIGLIYVGLQSKVIPYLLVLDNQGRELNAVQIKKDINPSQLESIRTSYIMDIIMSFRTVTPDSLIQKRFVNKVLNSLMPNSSAENSVKKYLNNIQNSPYELAKQYTVTPQMINIYPVSDKNNKGYQFEWQETWRDRQGNVLRTDFYKGLLKYEIRLAQDAQTLRQNPTGTWITNITYAQNLDINK